MSDEENPLKTFFSVLVTLYFLVSGIVVGLGLLVLLLLLLAR